MWQGRWSIVIKIVSLAVVFFALYSNIRLTMRNYQLNDHLREAEEQIKLKEIRNKKLSYLIYYYKSPEYQEVEARRRLDMKRPDETVIAIKGLQSNTNKNSISEIINEAETAREEVPINNYSKWWEYFFK